MKKYRLLTENLQHTVVNNQAVDIVKDMQHKPEYAVNSYFAIGHCNAAGHTIDYLYHIMSCNFPGQDPYWTYCFSVTDSTTKQFYQFSHAYDPQEVTVDKNSFGLETPRGIIKGDLNDLHLQCEIDNAALDLHLTAIDYPLYNAETGNFNLCGMNIYEYSIPKMLTRGTIKIGQQVYTVEDGISWYDRQWEIKLPKLPKTITKAMAKHMLSAEQQNPTWGWMDLNLDNGDVISTWFSRQNGQENCWGTLMHPDGSYRTVQVSPLIKQATNHWTSPTSGNAYPMTYYIQIPELAADLEVECTVKNQELVFPERPDLDHYEGAANISGTYQGSVVKGFTYVELIGDWSPLK